MNLQHLACFVAAAEELHFGRAARRLEVLPAAFGRSIRLLEEDLGAKLFERTTRTVALTAEGRQLLGEAQALIGQARSLRQRFREQVRPQRTTLRVGAIDSASLGLIPSLLNDFRAARPDVAVVLLEDKSIRLLPKLLSGRLDIAFVRPPPNPTKGIVVRYLFSETAMVAAPSGHILARRAHVTSDDLADEPLIVPDRRSRPHSHDLTIKILEESGHSARIAQIADEKQTILQLVSTGLGLAIIPRWMARTKVDGVVYLPFASRPASGSAHLPLAAAWVKEARDDLRDSLVTVLLGNIARYGRDA